MARLLTAGNMLRPEVTATVARLLRLAPSIVRAAGRTAHSASLAQPQATPDAPRSAFPQAPALADGEKIAYLLAIAALLAILAFTVWREFHSAFRAGAR
jgi:hypothetical protein